MFWTLKNRLENCYTERDLRECWEDIENCYDRGFIHRVDFEYAEEIYKKCLTKIQ